MNEQRIQQLKDSLREAVQILVSRGTALSDQEKVMLTQMMEHVATRIQQLRQEEQAQEQPQEQEQPISEQIPQEPPTLTPMEPPPEVPPLEPAPFESSNINAFQYEPRSQKLFVKFQDKFPGENGPIYQYEGVPSFVFDVFRRGSIAPKTSGRNQWHTWKQGVTPSHGAAMAALIKEGGYPYQRVR